MRLHRALINLTILSAMTALASPLAAAELKARTAVLVHGAFADGSSWHKVIPLLQKAGLKVVAVQNPLDSLESDVAATHRAIRNAEGPVVLVGHSWAGVVITEAGIDDKVKSLVYVAAYAPDKGESLQSTAAKFPAPEGRNNFVKDPDGFLTINDEGIRKYFAAGLPPQEQAIVAATQGPFHVRTTTTPVSHAAWRQKPTFMVVATKDTIISPQLQKHQVELTKATAVELPSSHVAMLAYPSEVAEMIIKASE